MRLLRHITYVLTVVMFNPVWAAPLLARSRGGWVKYSPGQLQAALRTLGTGPDARVAGQLRDKRPFSGYLNQIQTSRFLLMDSRTATVVPITYRDVRQLRGENVAAGVQFAARIGNGPPDRVGGNGYCNGKGEWIAAIGAIGFVVLAIAMLSTMKN